MYLESGGKFDQSQSVFRTKSESGGIQSLYGLDSVLYFSNPTLASPHSERETSMHNQGFRATVLPCLKRMMLRIKSNQLGFENHSKCPILIKQFLFVQIIFLIIEFMYIRVHAKLQIKDQDSSAIPQVILSRRGVEFSCEARLFPSGLFRSTPTHHRRAGPRWRTQHQN